LHRRQHSFSFALHSFLPPHMHLPRFSFSVLVAAFIAPACIIAAPQLPGLGAAMQAQIDAKEIAGAVTIVLTRDKMVHLESTGYADIATKRAITPDSIFWIASMTKPITGVAVMMLQDEGKLNVTDRVAKYVPEFANLKTPSGKPANLTLTQILTHTSGLGEVNKAAVLSARTLADLVPIWLAAPMQFEPGAKWSYCQSGINLAARIVEVVSGMTFDAFLQKRLFDPLGMKDTTFYLTDAQKARIVVGYAKNKETGELASAPTRVEYDGTRARPPQGNGGLYSTPLDYARFCQMLLNRGELHGKRYLSENAIKVLTSVHTGDLPTGFFQNEASGWHGTNYGWGILRPAHAARRRGGNVVTGHVWPWRRLGHAGVDRSGTRRRVPPDGAAGEFSKQ
jgi:CubicO group peptidase (beta-lactamase class C family)